MKCIRCDKNNTVCKDDMLQPGYVAEIYECKDCGGAIEVVYSHDTISRENIKDYRYYIK